MMIECERLSLVPLSRDFLKVSLQGEQALAEAELQARIAVLWPGEVADVLSLRLAQLNETPTLQPWLLRGMVLRDSNEMVGFIGFHTAPAPEYLQAFAPDAVEFGFEVFPAYRRQGYARESALALMQWAHATHGQQRFVLTISPDNHPSQALASGLGFRKIGSHIDEVDGPEDVLLMSLEA